MSLDNNPKQIPELTIIPTPTAWQESLIETVVARHDTYATSRMTLAQIFTLGSISGAIKSALDTLSGLISGNTSSINTLSSTKLNIAWGTRTGLTAKAVVATDASGNEVLITGTLWQQIGFDVSNTPVAITPTVDVHGLTQKTTPVWGDYTIITDSEASFVNKKITISSIVNVWGNGSDWALTISSWTTTIAFDATGYVEKNYTSFTMTGGTLNFSWPTNNGWIAVIKVQWDFSMTWSSILDISWMWWAWVSAASGLQGKSIVWVNTTNFWVWSGASFWVSAWSAGAWWWPLTAGSYFQWWCWAGGWSGWQWNWGWSWWVGWRWGWLIIIEVWWNFTFNSPAIIKANGLSGTVTWTDSAWNGWWGGWSIWIRTRWPVSYTWTLQVNWWDGTAGVTINYAMAGGGGGAWYSAWWAWGAIWVAWTAWTSNSFGNWGAWWWVTATKWGGGGGWAWYYKVN